MIWLSLSWSFKIKSLTFSSFAYLYNIHLFLLYDIYKVNNISFCINLIGITSLFLFLLVVLLFYLWKIIFWLYITFLSVPTHFSLNQRIHAHQILHCHLLNRVLVSYVTSYFLVAIVGETSPLVLIRLRCCYFDCLRSYVFDIWSLCPEYGLSLIFLFGWFWKCFPSKIFI